MWFNSLNVKLQTKKWIIKILLTVEQLFFPFHFGFMNSYKTSRKYNISSWVSTCRIHAEPLACRKPRDWRYLVHKSSTSRSPIPRARRCGTCHKNRQRLLQSCHLHVKDRNCENGCCGVIMFSPSMCRSCLARRLLEDSVWRFHIAKGINDRCLFTLK